MPNYRDTLTLEYHAGQRILVLQCNKSERKSLVKHHKEDGTTAWMSEKVASQHPDKTPKHLHISILTEGIYEVMGQPKLSGLYCFYKGNNGQLYYSSISQAEQQTLITQKKSGIDYRTTLLALNKKNIF
jgi:hypothetical protein